MNHKISIIESRPEHVHMLGKVMNDEDRAEAEAMGYNPHMLLWRSYRLALIRKTIFVNDKIAAMFGVSGVLTGLVGQPYLVTSGVAREVPPLAFARIYRNQVRLMLGIFPVLENIADSRYKRSIRLLRLTGFKLDEPQRHFGMDVLFQRYSLTA